MTKRLPFVSVVVICYNGEATLSAALDSLMQQTYPKGRYEIIVVDDGSTDNSAAVAAKYRSVQYVRLKENQGVSAARNAGLAVARGTIYAAFDCDCKAAPDWLRTVIAGYKDERVLGVGARLVEPEPMTRLSTRYISICDSILAPISSTDAHAHNLPHQRLLRYVKARLHTPVADTSLRQASELYGATGTFPVDVLRAVGGWDESMSGIEDRDLCQRLQAQFPDRLFYLAPSAKIIHERDEGLWRYLTRPVKRGAANLAFHRQNNITPPIFPFPLLYAAACSIGLSISLKTGVILLAGLPQLLYIWWPYKSFQRRQSILLLFPYIQLIEETMVIVGLVSGYLTMLQRGHHERHA